MISLVTVLVLAFVPGPGPGANSALQSGGCGCGVDLNPVAVIDTSQIIDSRLTATNLSTLGPIALKVATKIIDKPQPHLPKLRHH